MAAMANVILLDGQGTPASHTFVPGSAENGVFVWFEQNANSDAGNRKITMQIVRAKPGGNVNRVIFKLWNPTLEILGPASSAGYVAPQRMAYVLQTTVEHLLPVRSSKAERADSRAFSWNLLNDTQFKNAVLDLVTPTS
jgi:hypothetical protein